MKKFLLLVLILTAVTLPVRAEQSAAEEYRQMFRSGNFYVEYRFIVPNKLTNAFVGSKISSPKFTLAGQNGNRMQRITVDKQTSDFWKYYGDQVKISSIYLAAQSNINRTNIQYANHSRGFFGTSEKKHPDALFRDGKYYRFRKVNEIVDKSTIYGSDGTVYGKVLAQENLNSPTLNQDDEWNYIREDLSLPDELAVFCWDEPFRNNFTAAPVYVESSKLTIDKKEYDCDRYVADIKSLAGTVIAQEAYNMLYDGGKLVRVQKYLLRDGKEFLNSDLIVHTISAQAPDEAFAVKRKFKLYEARKGDMNDLINQLEQIGEIGGAAQ